jgi:hypothetical protein
MILKNYYYNCSPEYIYLIDNGLYDQIVTIISTLPKRNTQSEIKTDLFWLLASYGWNYDAVPANAGAETPNLFNVDLTLDEIIQRNIRDFCQTSTTLETRWHSDFAKSFESGIVQIEAQLRNVEAMFKDFCGFRIAYAERRLALGIEILLTDPDSYFSDRANSKGGMAGFDIAKNTMTTIGFNCPIWLIGIGE